MCVFSSHSFWTSMDVPAGVTQEEGNTGFSIHLSAVLALIFLARRIQPFLSLVDREVEFCVLTIESFSTHPLGILFLFFCFFSEKNPVCRDRTHVPTCQRLHGTSELPGRPAANRLCYGCQTITILHHGTAVVNYTTTTGCSTITRRGRIRGGPR